MMVASSGHGRQPGPDRFAAGRAAGDAALAGGVLGRHDDDDTVGRRPGDCVRSIDHADVAEQLVLLEGPEALPAPAADHDGPCVLSAGHTAAG